MPKSNETEYDNTLSRAKLRLIWGILTDSRTDPYLPVSGKFLAQQVTEPRCAACLAVLLFWASMLVQRAQHPPDTGTRLP